MLESPLVNWSQRNYKNLWLRRKCITTYSAAPPAVYHQLQCTINLSASQPTAHHHLHCITTYSASSSSLHHHLQCIITWSASPLQVNHYLQCITTGSASPPPMHHHSNASLIHLPSSYLISSSQIVLENIALVRSFNHIFHCQCQFQCRCQSHCQWQIVSTEDSRRHELSEYVWL